MFDEYCQQFRKKWLDEREMALADGVRALDVADNHQSTCNACGDWVRSTKKQIEILEALPLLEAPAELDELVETVMETPPSEDRIEEIMAALPKRQAPSELGERIAQQLERESKERAASGESERSVKSVGTLHIEPVPSVLDRLVDEELQTPEAHRSDRFVGNLEPRKAPKVLAKRVAGALGRHRVPRLVIAPLATLAAAALLLWVALRGDQEANRYSFEVVYTEDLSTLDPFARGLAEALSAGAANALRPRETDAEEGTGG